MGKARTSAGIALFRHGDTGVMVLLVHPGGPYWRGKDAGAWSFPKGELGEGENPLEVARRELAEETGCVPEGEFIPLGSVKQKGGKTVHLWAVAGDCDASAITSNTFTIEWPPKSGRMGEFPEVDRAGWFSLDEARVKLLESQLPFLDRLGEAAKR